MFGQIVIGPPGSGKTTYTIGMHNFLTQLGRNCVVINLDPANDVKDNDVVYGQDCPVRIDINDLVTLEDVMDELSLGPNGGMVYCMEFLEKNITWLENHIRNLLAQDQYTYMLFDLPGQVEISTHHSSLRNIIVKIRKELDLRLTTVHLVDAVHCSDPSKYISAVFLSLSTMLRLECPHVNVLSKIDLVESEGTLDFNLDFYTDVMDLKYLLPLLGKTPTNFNLEKNTHNNNNNNNVNDNNNEENEINNVTPKTYFEEKFNKLNEGMIDLIDQFSLVAFHPLNIQDKESVLNLVKHIDKTNEYINVISEKEDHLMTSGGQYIDMVSLMEKYTPS